MTRWTLAIDTSTQVCAGLSGNGDQVISRAVGDNHSHVELLVPTIESLLAEAGAALADVERIGVGVGPGPYTGLRVGLSAAVTLSLVSGAPLRGVCSLDLIAAQWTATGSAPEEFVVASDARRKELYWARYRDGVRVGSPQVAAPARLPELPLAGPGVDVYPQLLGTRRPAEAPRSIDAGFLAAHLDELPDAGVEPLYLRKPDAELPSARKSALNGRHRRLAPARRAAR